MNDLDPLSTENIMRLAADHEILYSAFRGRPGASGAATHMLYDDHFGYQDPAQVMMSAEVEVALPSKEELLADPDLWAAVATIGVMSERVFGSMAGVAELQVEHDPVLGGVYLEVEIPVSGMDLTAYRAAREDFDEAVISSISTGALQRLVISTRLDA